MTETGRPMASARPALAMPPRRSRWERVQLNALAEFLAARGYPLRSPMTGPDLPLESP